MAIFNQIPPSGGGGGSSEPEYVTFSFTGGNSWYVYGTTDNGMVNGALYASGSSVRMLKDSFFMIGKKDDSLSQRATNPPTWAISNTGSSINDGVTTSRRFNNPQGYLVGKAIGFATNDATFYADID